MCFGGWTNPFKTISSQFNVFFVTFQRGMKDIRWILPAENIIAGMWYVCTLACWTIKKTPRAVTYFDALLHLCVWRLSLLPLWGALIQHNDFCGESPFHNGQPCLVPYLLSGLYNTGAEYEHASEESNPSPLFSPTRYIRFCQWIRPENPLYWNYI